MNSKSNKDDDSDDQPTEDEIIKAYQHMANQAAGPTVPTPPGGNDTKDETDNTETTDDPEAAVEEVTCAECGHGGGVYPDDALDQFTKNLDGETVHYGCR